MIAGVIDLLSRHKAENVYTRPRTGRILFDEHWGGRSRVGLAVVAHHVRDVGVAGSNPATPTNT